MANYQGFTFEKAQEPEELEKGRKALPGEIHRWKGKDYQKQATGKWTKTEKVESPENNKSPEISGDSGTKKSKEDLINEHDKTKKNIQAYERQIRNSGYSNPSEHPNYSEWGRLKKVEKSLEKAINEDA